MNVAQLLPVLYFLFTFQAHRLARTTGFIRRTRALDGATFLQTLVFGWMRRPQAPLEHLAHDLGISRQALDQRFTPAAVAFAKAALLQAVQQVFQARPATLSLLRSFQGVYIEDATQLWLPDAAYQQFPSSAVGKARLKVLLRWELQGGNVHHLGLHPARTGDTTALADAPPLPKGCLHLADLGFTDFQRLQDENDAGIFWITRLPAQTRLFLCQPLPRSQRGRPAEDGAAGRPLWQHLRQWRLHKRRSVDVSAWVGDKVTVKGRLIALACPPDVVARRLARLGKDARHRGRLVSARQEEMCHWTVLWTNVPAEQLTALQVWQIYRLRWQIELLIKRFKSEGGLGCTTSSKPERVEVEWYLKLLGQVVRNWLQLLRGGPLCCVNSQQLGRVIVDELGSVVRALREGVVVLLEVLWALQERLGRVRARTSRQQQKTAGQRLAEEAAVGAAITPTE
jgi:hypothetical protein